MRHLSPAVCYTEPSQLALTNARKCVDLQSKHESDNECFEADNHQIWMHLWGPGVMGVYMIIIKMLRKCILNSRIFYYHRCEITLWGQLKEPLCRAWLGCSPSGYTPSDDYGISTQQMHREGASRSADSATVPSVPDNQGWRQRP